MKKRGFTLVELLAVIIVLAIILILAVPKVNDYIVSSKKQTFTTNALNIARELEYDNIDFMTFEKAHLKDFDLKEINRNNIDVENSLVYVRDNEIYVDLIGKGSYEGFYVCNVGSSTKNVIVQSVECETTIDNLIYIDFNVDLNGGQSTQSFSSKYISGSYLTLQIPTKDGLTFAGWEVVSGNSTLSGNRIKFGTEATEIKALWKQNPILTIILNGGTTSQSFETTYKAGTSLTLINPSKTEHTFIGWKVTSGNGLVSGNTFVMGSEDTELTAKWAINTYEITYNLDGGIRGMDAPTSGTYGSTVTVSNPIKTGYTFTGWTVSGTGAEMSGTKLTIGAGNVTLTANWTINTYTITYNLGGGTKGTDAPTSGTYGSTVTVSNPTRTGYIFTGWILSGTGATISETNLTIGTSDVILTANWIIDTSIISTYTITYNLNGGTKGTNAPTIGVGGSTVTVSNPTRTGYTFTGWSVLGTGAIISGTNLTIGTSDVTLTANWTINTYTISYTLNGGTKGTNAPTSGTYGSTVTVSNPTRTGYTFTGWTVSGTGAEMSGTTLTIGTSNITLTANWTINTYTISYTLNGGTKGTNAPTSGTYGSTVTVSNPTRTGYAFTGWSVSGTGAIMSGTNLTIGTSNITLTANWKVVSPVYSYKCANGSVGSSPYLITYTGNCTVIDDKNNNWRIKFLTSGTLTTTSNMSIDAFLVGGGGGGAGGNPGAGNGAPDNCGSSGGGGGFTATYRAINLTNNTGYSINIGAGGTGGAVKTTGGDGGATSAFGYSVNGGTGGKMLSHVAFEVTGGTGSSGGGVGTCNYAPGNGGYNGGDGGKAVNGDIYWNGSTNKYIDRYGVYGGGLTTREFGESTGILYAGGGGGGTGTTNDVGIGYGGEGGGGNGGYNSTTGLATAGTVNTGSGGGGGFTQTAGGAGGSGIVVIRNKRTTTEYDFTYTGGEQTFTVPVTGTYKLEVWGAQGGRVPERRGGYGGYSVGEVSLTAGQKLYVNVGGYGDGGYPNVLRAGGYNGGGNVPLTNSNTNRYVASGGGATHIATVSGVLSSLSSYATSCNSLSSSCPILIVAGGGGGSYQHTTSGYYGHGGDGGGYQGVNGNIGTSGGGAYGTGGSQTAAGFAYGDSSVGIGGFGYGGDTGSTTHGGAGGGGYYGGGGSKAGTGAIGNSSGGGGSGYIGNPLLTNKLMNVYCDESTATCPTSSATSTYTVSVGDFFRTAVPNVAKQGCGHVKITLVQ